jgi:hypothetical protein
LVLFSIDKSVLKNYHTLVKERMNGGIIMRLWKKALSLVLVSAMAFSMCACGGKKDEGKERECQKRVDFSLAQIQERSFGWTEQSCPRL